LGEYVPGAAPARRDGTAPVRRAWQSPPPTRIEASATAAGPGPFDDGDGDGVMSA
jgi:hypothetical protein